MRPTFLVLGVTCGSFCMLWYLSSRHHSAQGTTTYTASAANRHTDVNVSVFRLQEKNNKETSAAPLKCMAGSTSRPIHLFVAVLSTTNRAQTRLTARKTWMIYNLPREMTTTMRFMIGTNGLSEQQVEKLREEQMTYGDLVMFDTHNDTYRHLTKKVQLAIQWAVSNVHFDYLLKTDDDVIVHLRNFVTELIKLGCPDNLYWGYHIVKTPDAEGKWKDTEWSRLCKTYLPYRAGLGYVIGWQVIKAAAMYGDHLKKLFLEDVSMGLWLSPYKLTRVSNYRQFISGKYHYDNFILRFIHSKVCHFSCLEIWHTFCVPICQNDTSNVLFFLQILVKMITSACKQGVSELAHWCVKMAHLHKPHINSLCITKYLVCRVSFFGTILFYCVGWRNCPKDFIAAHQGSAKQFEVATTNLVKTGRYCT